MNTFLSRMAARAGTCVALMSVITMILLAGPAAYAHEGKPIDSPAARAGGATAPRIEAQSRLFELVGYLRKDELSVMINRFETNEAVLDAKVEVTAGTLKTVARFHNDHGDYAVDDPAFLKLLSSPGEHPLIFTITAGKDNDLLEGKLVTTGGAHAHSHDHSHALEYALVGAGVLALAAGAAVLWRRRMRSRSSYAGTGRVS